MQKLAIFGAKSIALGVYRAIQELYREYEVVVFLVSSKENNPDTLAGLSVVELDHFHEKDIYILIATPENFHADIVRSLEEHQFHHYICMDWRREAKLMEKYYEHIGMFQSIHTLTAEGEINWQV